jgi:CBS domain-containing protein
MDVELIEIRDFLATHPPFDLLSAAALDRLPRRLKVQYFRRGTAFPPEPGEGIEPSLYILRRGAVELRDAAGDLLGKLAEGDICPLRCQLEGQVPVYSGVTVEDTLVYQLPCAELDALRQRHETFAQHFDHSVTQRLRKAMDTLKDGPTSGFGLMTVRVRDLINRNLISAPAESSIREAARIMTEHRVSSLVIMDGERLAGMITDRDLRSRCIVAGIAPEEPVARIMTDRLHTTDSGSLGFQALIKMTRLNVHHLPVVEDGRVVGVVSTSDFVRVQSANSVYLVGDIHKARNLDILVQISAKVSELQVQLVNSGATADQVGQAVSAVTDAITQRLLDLAEMELGPAPVPYAWLAGGSQARREQSSHSDQDNALLIADHMKPGDDAWFEALARYVNDGLNACGYVFCPGEVMASNPKWRQPLRLWRKYFTNWIERPEPMALMLASVFFDLRPVRDPEGMFEELQEHVVEHSRANRIFIAYMAANALKHRPPLGFFRNFVLIHGGEHDHTFDLKHRGTVPIIDMARVHALAAGVTPINTLERIQAASTAGVLSSDGAANLNDAMELIGTLRMRHQAQQLRRGEPADNYLSPDDLSPLERGHLRDAFVLINSMQESLGQRYQAGRFS